MTISLFFLPEYIFLPIQWFWKCIRVHILFEILGLQFVFVRECNSPPHKKLKTSSVVVDQGKASDKILIDQVTDVDSIYDEVS